MDKEHSIIASVEAAQKSSELADALIRQYMPFIKSETAKVIGRFPTEGTDELSIAMFAFYEAIMAYQSKKGAFLNFKYNSYIEHKEMIFAMLFKREKYLQKIKILITNK